jgi:hypothetical protein
VAKFHDKIGFVTTVETAPGVHREQPIERTYSGDVLQNSRRLQTTDSINDKIVISNRISIMSDRYARENFHAIRYAVFMGSRWKVEHAEYALPRIILNLGGVYNGEQTEATRRV